MAVSIAGFTSVSIATCNKSSDTEATHGSAAAGDTSRTCTATFELLHEAKPFGGETIAIAPVADGKISLSKDKKRGSGTTDAAGRVSIEFKCGAATEEFAILGEMKEALMLLRRGGDALTFTCGGATTTCALGTIAFQTFEFGFSRSSLP